MQIKLYSGIRKNISSQLGKLKIEARGNRLELTHMNKWRIYDDDVLAKSCG